MCLRYTKPFTGRNQSRLAPSGNLKARFILAFLCKKIFEQDVKLCYIINMVID